MTLLSKVAEAAEAPSGDTDVFPTSNLSSSKATANISVHKTSTDVNGSRFQIATTPEPASPLTRSSNTMEKPAARDFNKLITQEEGGIKEEKELSGRVDKCM
jgi:hypothetical protein